MSTWSVAILAGGRGRRLGGRTKPLLEVGGQSILARQQAMLASLGVVPRLVAPDPAAFAGLGLEVVADDGRTGALGALCLALERAATDVVVILAGDMPFVTAGFVRALLAALEGHDAAVPRTARDGWQPLAAAYRRSAAARLRAGLDAGERRVVAAVTALAPAALDDDVLAALDPDGTLLCNVNTPDDYARARRLASAPAGRRD
jgi:molybdopterin-guanine dinucleotide biosynthesis protein A